MAPERPAAAETTSASPPARDRSQGAAKPAGQSPGVTRHQPTSAAAPPDFTDDPETRRHIAEFEDALAALAQSLAEAKAHDAAAGEAKVAGAD
jgi:hypothetical protein